METNKTKELKYFHFNADYSCEASEHCVDHNIDYVYCGAYVDMTIEVNKKEYHLQLQNGNSYDYLSYNCPTNRLSIYKGVGDASFFKAIKDNDLEAIQEYDETITQEQLNELTEEFEIVLQHYQELVDEEEKEAENKKIYEEATIYDEDGDSIQDYCLLLDSETEDFLNDYKNQIKEEDFEAKKSEIKAKYLAKYQQENDLSDDDIVNFTCKLSFKYFYTTLNK